MKPYTLQWPQQVHCSRLFTGGAGVHRYSAAIPNPETNAQK